MGALRHVLNSVYSLEWVVDKFDSIDTTIGTVVIALRKIKISHTIVAA